MNSADRDLALGLVADVDDGVVLGHLNDGALDDLALLEDALAAALLERGLEHRGEIFVAAFDPGLLVHVLLHVVGNPLIRYSCPL